MSWLDKITNVFTGGLASTVMDTIKSYFPPDLTPEQEAEIKLALTRLEMEKTLQVSQITADAEKRLTRRIAELEGTAKDLKTIPLLGPMMLFLRGCQRPIWGFATLYMDAMWFGGTWGQLTQTQESALMLVNGLVLGFLFGERALQNAAPMIERMMRSRHEPKN
ncbi:hypothetical protein NB537_00410 [Vibrio parahaemolyticus]|uniref:hypothetical protein n=1 Tax=Vibrio harveyi group TaxID=717610 RepID=UPI000CE3FE25|nr:MULTISPECIES: hypothetical protein [Vibrio harveyi group]MCE7729242.1 hypothetical protein [Vibrio campbellii]MCR9653262.1 hypothetical protein [Vibrio parahaemolyticus]